MTISIFIYLVEVVHYYSYQIVHVGFASGLDVLQELQQVKGVAVHQMDSDG